MRLNSFLHGSFLHRSILHKSIATVAPALALALLSTSALAANLVMNGGFEQLSVSGPQQLSNPHQLPDWTLGPSLDGYTYDFLFTPGSADTTGAPEAIDSNTKFKLWGPGTGSHNGLPATSPDGGNYLALNSTDLFRDSLSQTITNLTPGRDATVSFYWAAAQEYTFNGPTTDKFQISLGGQTQSTAVLTIPNEGFSGWRQASLTFLPTSAIETLSFLAFGTPGGGPPQALLDGVSVTQTATPEPATWALMIVSLGMIAAYRYKSRKAA